MAGFTRLAREGCVYGGASHSGKIASSDNSPQLQPRFTSLEASFPVTRGDLKDPSKNFPVLRRGSSPPRQSCTARTAPSQSSVRGLGKLVREALGSGYLFGPTAVWILRGRGRGPGMWGKALTSSSSCVALVDPRIQRCQDSRRVGGRHHRPMIVMQSAILLGQSFP